MLKRVLCYIAICLAVLLAALCASCKAPDAGTETRESVTQSEETSPSESETATDTERETVDSSDTEPETSVREPASDGFPNEAESGGTKRY